MAWMTVCLLAWRGYTLARCLLRSAPLLPTPAHPLIQVPEAVRRLWAEVEVLPAPAAGATDALWPRMGQGELLAALKPLQGAAVVSIRLVSALLLLAAGRWQHACMAQAAAMPQVKPAVPNLGEPPTPNTPYQHRLQGHAARATARLWGCCRAGRLRCAVQ